MPGLRGQLATASARCAPRCPVFALPAIDDPATCSTGKGTPAMRLPFTEAVSASLAANSRSGVRDTNASLLGKIPGHVYPQAGVVIEVRG